MSQNEGTFVRGLSWVSENLDHVRMPAVKCKFGVNTNSASLDALCATKVHSANDSEACLKI